MYHINYISIVSWYNCKHISVVFTNKIVNFKHNPNNDNSSDDITDSDIDELITYNIVI